MHNAPAPAKSATRVSVPAAPATGRPAPSRLAPGSALAASDTFPHRHIGPCEEEVAEMLALLGRRTLDELTDATVPSAIRLGRALQLPGASAARGEHETLEDLRRLASKNAVLRSCLGMGYHDCITPPVILRNVLENPGWYTQYTPYQAEIAQGRLEALLNFQTMVADLTGLPLAGASLLDEATAAAEAMAMCLHASGGGSGEGDGGKRAFFVAQDCHPQTIAVVRTRGASMGVEIRVGDPRKIDFAKGDLCGILLQYPTTDGRIEDYWNEIEAAHKAGALAVVAADLLALTLLTPPGEFGADIAVGSAQRMGVPMGFGGPHAAYIACKSEHARRMPGRIIGVSKDAHGNPALRMAIQTREQHIRRERATSNICTAQALLAIMASFYAVYHGPDGLRDIARRVHGMTIALAEGLKKMGVSVPSGQAFFDTLRVKPAKGSGAEALKAARAKGYNLRDFGDGTVGVTFDETTSREDVANVLSAFGATGADADALLASSPTPPGDMGCPTRSSAFLTHTVFNLHHSETELLRYIFTLQGRDLSLAHSMIALGSCTMKLNATSEMLPVTWPEFARMHPFAPADQTKGYLEMFARLELWLCEITGFAACSLQPNAGSQGEYAGLLVIHAYHQSRGQSKRNICLIPDSAHGTNPASAVIAGFHVVPVACDERGNIEIGDLRAKAEQHKDDLGALMLTYPSTHGVFEEGVKEICAIIHERGGQVYMDGANMNAQVGLTSPGVIGADVCHLNLHKTFCIPHGGGGPGMGPICVAAHLAPFLPGHPVISPFGESSKRQAPSTKHSGSNAIGPVSAAPWGSPAILTISYVYIALMGAEGLRRATQVAILNANYMAKRLEGRYPILYRGANGHCAHEFILDCRHFEKTSGVKIDDIAKRLMDYGFHAPTMSFPVPGTLMIEPTESEPKTELDRFCDAMIGIREEIRAIEEGKADRADNVLKGAPHTAEACVSDAWSHKYPREQAAFPTAWVKNHKFWPHVGRIDNPYGDRNLICTCPAMSEY